MTEQNSSSNEGSTENERASQAELPQIVADALDKTKDLPVVSEWVQVMLVPLRFFGEQPAEPDLSKPFTFLAGVTGVAALSAALYSLVSGHAGSAITSFFYAVCIWGA